MHALVSSFDLIQVAASATPSPSPRDGAAESSGWTPQAMTALAAVLVTLGVGVANLLISLRTKPIERTRLLTERFGKAAEQIGHNEPTVRLAGVFAMAALADEWREQRQQRVDVLCAYMRLPPRKQPGEKQVRGTIVDVIADHVSKSASVSWSALNFNFTGATFIGDTSFPGATFAGYASFKWATFETVAYFRSAVFKNLAQFEHARFNAAAVFKDATFSPARFNSVTFKGAASFSCASFKAGASFPYAMFEGLSDFDDATFTSYTQFDEADFAMGAQFRGAVFKTGTEASFAGARTRLAIDLTEARTEEAPATFVMPDRSKTHELPLIPANWDGEEE